jgi:phosphate:Na+ symporter
MDRAFCREKEQRTTNEEELDMSILDVFALLGGVGLFLYGMMQMSDGLKNAAGDHLRIILEKATRNRVVSVLVGVLVTLMIQSSSATDVMVIGFVNSGLMNLSQALGVIMGANIGTTVTAQLTAFNLSAYAPVILFVGAVMYLFMKKAQVRYVGSVIMGFGMLFEGIALMKAAIVPMSETPEFVAMLRGISNPAAALLFGLAFTALVQSSSSSIAIFQTFAIQGILDYQTTVYLIIGAAVGSVTPNLLASLTTNRNGKRSALLNLIFNLIRACILMLLITVFPRVLTLIQSLAPGDIGRQIAHTHTLFAIFAVLVELPLSNLIVRLSRKMLPVLPSETQKAEHQRLVYLTQLDTIPVAVALSQAKLEIVRMGKFAERNLRTAIDCVLERDEEKRRQVLETEAVVDYLDGQITQALINMRYHHMTDKELNRLSRMLLVVSDIERISDHAENLTKYMLSLKERRVSISEPALEDLREISDATMAAMHVALEVFAGDQFDRLDEAERLENVVDDLEERCVRNHMDRLLDSTCNPVCGVIFSDMVTDLERCADHAVNIAFSLSGKSEKSFVKD